MPIIWLSIFGQRRLWGRHS